MSSNDKVMGGVRFDGLERYLIMEPEHQESFTDSVSRREEAVFAAAARRIVDAWHVSPDEISAYYAKALARIGGIAVDRATSLQRKGSRRVVPVSLGTRSMRRSVWYGAVTVIAAALFIVGEWGGVARGPGRNQAAKTVVYSTANGQRATITLTDGSVVMLNVASRLEIPSDYATGNHTIRLVGEALFLVSHHDETPFTVLAGPAVTRVLGTSFLVRRYGTDTATTVAVQSGKVSVGSAILVAGRYVEVGPSNTGPVLPADASQFSFAAGVLSLRSIPLSRAIPELNRWYDADIRLGDIALATRHMTGKFEIGSLAELSAILELTGVRVVRDGRIITLYSR
jgi:transmembrane sensor